MRAPSRWRSAARSRCCRCGAPRPQALRPHAPQAPRPTPHAPRPRTPRARSFSPASSPLDLSRSPSSLRAGATSIQSCLPPSSGRASPCTPPAPTCGPTACGPPRLRSEMLANRCRVGQPPTTSFAPRPSAERPGEAAAALAAATTLDDSRAVRGCGEGRGRMAWRARPGRPVQPGAGGATRTLGRQDPTI